MTFTIEPMINAGQRQVKMLPDQWTVVTKDHKLSAQWEHTILVTADGAEVLTLRAEETLPVNRRRRWARPAASIVSADSALAQRFWAGEDIDQIVRGRAAFFDGLIKGLWSGIDWPEGSGQQLALFAVGGYGRGELHPHSDIDLLILVDGDPAEYGAGIETFVQNLWDLKLNIGHSVRTIDQCQQEAKDDIATATSILERRLLAGTLALDRQVGRLFATDEIWPSARFFSAKADEQRKRHDRYQDVDYNLEPNIKGAPGRSARHPDDRLDHQAAFRQHVARRPHRPRLSDAAGTPVAGRRPALPVARALRSAPARGTRRRPVVVRLPAHPRRTVRDTRTPKLSSASNSSCTTTTATC